MTDNQIPVLIVCVIALAIYMLFLTRLDKKSSSVIRKNTHTDTSKEDPYFEALRNAANQSIWLNLMAQEAFRKMSETSAMNRDPSRCRNSKDNPWRRDIKDYDDR